MIFFNQCDRTFLHVAQARSLAGRLNGEGNSTAVKEHAFSAKLGVRLLFGASQCFQVFVTAREAEN